MFQGAPRCEPLNLGAGQRKLVAKHGEFLRLIQAASFDILPRAKSFRLQTKDPASDRLLAGFILMNSEIL